MLKQRPISDHIIIIFLVSYLGQGVVYHVIVNIKLISQEVNV
jgi:hypothetical protein